MDDPYDFDAHPFGAGPGAGRPRGILARVLARLLEAAARRRSLRALAALEPHLLADVGLTRNDLRSAARTFPSGQGPAGGSVPGRACAAPARRA